MKVLSTRVHGVIDYISVITLFTLPRVLGASDRVTMLFTVMAIGTLLYSLATRYELGVAKVLPMRAHLLLDLMSGALFLALAILWGDAPQLDRILMGVMGMFEIGASLITNPEPSLAGAADAGSAARPRQRGF